ncbi:MULTISPECIES: NUDIX hydrolase [Bacillales]|jgi:ADP-ribose pyrophosphatase YjhB (NUDIX family)|uniref:ADP-ribose pyrophosphatase YjhB (NUDIX family) n=1 Tax=[Anoxybacillus] calidus TaxID=575178 RepID=A0A7V9YXP7_9BACL|nr:MULTISPECIES: NUDIX hydrolase [Bacillaceae]MBA2870352.1 ADP-ribose pyrophosphatase YjhB (NUDIX family) [Anoxybacillus calidus]
MWKGAAAVCVNELGQLLMVKQGKPDEQKLWSVPSGGKEEHESFEQCCLRELFEETGYKGKIVRKLFEKKGHSFGIAVHVHYFEVEITGGKPTILDPDELIHDIRWISPEELSELPLSFPEDREFLMKFLSDRGANRISQIR